MLYIGIILGLTILWKVLFPTAPTDSYIHWFLYSAVLFIVNLLVALVIYVVLKQAYFLNRLMDMFKRKWRRGVNG